MSEEVEAYIKWRNEVNEDAYLKRRFERKFKKPKIDNPFVSTMLDNLEKDGVRLRISETEEIVGPSLINWIDLLVDLGMQKNKLEKVLEALESFVTWHLSEITKSIEESSAPYVRHIWAREAFGHYSNFEKVHKEFQDEQPTFEKVRLLSSARDSAIDMYITHCKVLSIERFYRSVLEFGQNLEQLNKSQKSMLFEFIKKEFVES